MDFIDKIKGTPQEEVTTIVNKRHVQSSSVNVTNLIPIGKVMVPLIQQIPIAEKYELEFEIDGKLMKAGVQKAVYDKYNVNDAIHVFYKKNLLNKVVVTGIAHTESLDNNLENTKPKFKM